VTTAADFSHSNFGRSLSQRGRPNFLNLRLFVSLVNVIPLALHPQCPRRAASNVRDGGERNKLNVSLPVS
jgi:hypothetical protein